jgi:hypothetical protein
MTTTSTANQTQEWKQDQAQALASRKLIEEYRGRKLTPVEYLELLAYEGAEAGETPEVIFQNLRRHADYGNMRKFQDELLREIAKNVWNHWWANPRNHWDSRAGSFEYVLGPLDKTQPGWESRGLFACPGVHGIAGASGSNKSTIAYLMLIRQFEKQLVWGRESFGLPFRVVMADRDQGELDRTLHNLQIDPDAFCLSKVWISGLRTS